MAKKLYENRDQVRSAKTVISCSASKKEKEMVRQMAMEMHMSISGYVRYILFVKNKD